MTSSHQVCPMIVLRVYGTAWLANEQLPDRVSDTQVTRCWCFPEAEADATSNKSAQIHIWLKMFKASLKFRHKQSGTNSSYFTTESFSSFTCVNRRLFTHLSESGVINWWPVIQIRIWKKDYGGGGNDDYSRNVASSVLFFLGMNQPGLCSKSSVVANDIHLGQLFPSKAAHWESFTGFFFLFH